MLRNSLLKCLKTELVSLVRGSRCLCASAGLSPRRSLLYIPGNDERKLKKATGLGADIVVLDCEDGVAINRKVDARHTIQRVLGDLDFGRSEVCVRVNSVNSGLAEEDLQVVLSGSVLPETLMLPKLECISHIDWLSENLQSIGKSRTLHNFKIIGIIETAKAIVNLSQILQKATEEEKLFDFQAVIFGSDDLLASIGGTRTKDSMEVLYARQCVVTHAKAFGLQAIDMVHIDYKDLDGLRENSEAGARMGYTGKQIIHPGQIDIVNKAFSPSEDRIKWAKDLIQAFNEHQETGKGAMSFQGEMIDMPLVLQARNILRLADTTKP